MLHMQSFTLIKSANVRFSSPGTGGIPSPTVQHIHSLANVCGIFQKTTFRSAQLTQRYDFWISPIAMNLRLQRYV
jgi:hypothetical protein